MKAITFVLPEGVQVPDGKKVGETFQAMATFELETGGKVTLTEIDGEPLDPKDDEKEDVNEGANDDTTNAGPPGLMAPGGMQAALGMGGG